MNVKDAVRAAKHYVAELFAEEGLINLGLEEIEHDEIGGTWNITVGFSRHWNAPMSQLAAMADDRLARRSYRVVKVRDTDGEVLSVKRSEVAQD